MPPTVHTVYAYPDGFTTPGVPRTTYVVTRPYAVMAASIRCGLALFVRVGYCRRDNLPILLQGYERRARALASADALHPPFWPAADGLQDIQLSWPLLTCQHNALSGRPVHRRSLLQWRRSCHHIDLALAMRSGWPTIRPTSCRI